ncbi:MAG: bifunctional phosphoribosylaminoimidazolecarboxamide formyltransferase/IMP cyclohydrolase [Staphylococcus epidermidis]|nr:bifunctional phosphoribosylaminoimidazolecarboxamide formyltransferase/IMP cyclohydrolase [Staphylococcus epidermidis]
MKKAILSVSNKSGIVEFAKALTNLDYELYSTGGTKRVLEDANINIKSVSELTQFPEIMDGRVKTLHPAVHGGILADRDKEHHLEQLREQHIDLIDMVVVNLYPFQQTVAQPDVTETDAIENIDIGGPTMLRAAAKNFKHVTTIVHPSDYNEVIEQSAYFVRTSDSKHTIAGAKQLHGKQLSFNNIKDADAALSLVKKFNEPTAVAVKHMNPCGVGIGQSIDEAFQHAYEADNQSIFGGIIALNRTVDVKLAEALHSIFLEVVIAPQFTEEALKILTQKKNIRLLQIDMTIDNAEQEFVSVSGGYLVQDKDNKDVTRNDMTVATDIQPTEAQWEAMLLGWKVVSAVKSNAVILSNNKQTVGIGAGQMNRVGSAKIAIERAIEINDNVALVSDGFFPMGDTVEYAAEHGIKAIIQPGGSIKDQDSIDMANKYGITMVMTGMRHFKH